jgi:hypothetical protein
MLTSVFGLGKLWNRKIDMKNINIKTLAKGMRVEDKAKLLFADRDKRAETSGKEGLLTPDEEKAIIEDAQDLRQITELNRFNKLYNIASFLLLDIQTAFLNFELANERVLTVLTAMILVGEATDALGDTIYALATAGYSEEQLEDKTFQKEVDQKADDFRKKYKSTDLTKIYDYFEPSLRETSYFSTKAETLSQPNPLLQRAFMEAVKRVKQFRKQVYSSKYVESKAGMELLSERDRQTINGFTKEIDEFVNLESYLGLIKMYADFADKGMLRNEGLIEPKFIEAIKDMKKATRLGKKGRVITEMEIEDVIYKHNN